LEYKNLAKRDDLFGRREYDLFPSYSLLEALKPQISQSLRPERSRYFAPPIYGNRPAADPRNSQIPAGFTNTFQLTQVEPMQLSKFILESQYEV